MQNLGPNNQLFFGGAFSILGTAVVDFDNGSAAATVTTSAITVPANTKSALLLFTTENSGAPPVADVKIGGSGGLSGTSLEHINITGSFLPDFQAIKFANMGAYTGSRTLYFDWSGAQTSRYVRGVIVFIGTNNFALTQSDFAETGDVNPIVSHSGDLDLSLAPTTTPAGTAGNLMFAFGLAYYNSTAAGETFTLSFNAVNFFTPTYSTTTDFGYDPTADSFALAFAYHDNLAAGGTKTAQLESLGNPNGGTATGSSFLYLIEIEEA